LPPHERGEELACLFCLGWEQTIRLLHGMVAKWQSAFWAVEFAVLGEW
jgi:hypothetical protein